MTGNSEYCSAGKDSWSYEGRFFIVVIILAVLHVISFTWMIHMQLHVFKEQEKDGIMQQFEGDVASPNRNGELHRDARALKTCEKFRSRVERCTQLDGKNPRFAKQTDKKRHLIQLRGQKGHDGLGSRIVHTGDDVVKDWTEDLSEGNGLKYDKHSGFVEILEGGFYYIYAQMLPYLFSNGETEWQFSIQRKTKDGSLTELAIAKLSIPGCTKCSKTSMAVSRMVYLEVGDSVAVRINEGTLWYSSTVVQTFGAFLL